MAALFFLLSLSISLAFAGSIQFTPEYSLDWAISGNLITFDLTVTRQAWVGLGFHAVGSNDNYMTNADVIATTFDGSGVPTILDYFAQGFATPILDTDLGGTNNVLQPSGSQGPTVTHIKFSRALNTGDKYDTVFSPGQMKVIWALGSDNVWDYHGFGATNRGQVLVNFFATNESSLEQVSKQGCPNSLPNAWVPNGFCASVWASGLSSPRGLDTARNGDILVVESGKSAITALWDSNGDGISDVSERATIASGSQLTHSIKIYGDYVYASSPTTVYRWKYTAGQRTDLGQPQIVLNSVPCCHHVSRTIAFDNNARIYVSVGSASNVDRDSTHARVKRFNVSDIPASGGINWDYGQVFADGLRNEVGLTFDADGNLWGVENGVDNLNRQDLGGDIHNNNPSEEVNLFAQPAKFYGYPYCWTEYDLPTYGQGRGTQWAHPNFINDGTHTDAWCRDTQNNLPPAYSLAAHQAPLDILFYNGKSFPQYQGDALVTLHGSWNRNPPIGYRVVRLKFQNGRPTGEDVLLRNNGNSQNWPNNVRPVALTLGPCSQPDCLYVSSDASGQIIQMSYQS